MAPEQKAQLVEEFQNIDYVIVFNSYLRAIKVG
jgi:hypothetical protein